MKNNVAHKIKFHDTTYLNSWIIDNKNDTNILTNLLSFGKIAELNEKPFYLVDKEEVGIKKKKIVAPFYIPGCRLGNCLFSFAAAYAHALKRGYDLHSPYNKYIDKIIGYSFNHNCDNIINTCYKEPTYSYTEIPANTSGFIAGFFQSSKYFDNYKKQVMDIFAKLWQGVQQDEKKAAIHIRLGDYLKETWRFRSPKKEFIEKALSYLSPSITKLEIFSDDPETALSLVSSCKKAKKYQLILNNGDEIESIRGIISASEFIMSCSSFSWWAAYLGNHKKVIVDKQWYNDGVLDTKDLYESNWLKI